MAREAWINLPVADIERSREFFRAVGFDQSEQWNRNPGMLVVEFGGSTRICMFPTKVFESFVSTIAADPTDSAEFLISVGADSPEEVRELIEKARAAGATVLREPGERDGWMYGGGFSDPDGHRWNILYMDMEKMPKR